MDSTVPRRGCGGGAHTGLSTGKRLGVGLSVSCGAGGLRLRLDLRIPTDPGGTGGRMVVLGLVRDIRRVPQDPWGGVSLEGCALAQDGRCVRTRQLGGE